MTEQEHKTEIIITRLMGVHHQAKCSCGWLAKWSHQTNAAAQEDARNHVKEHTP